MSKTNYNNLLGKRASTSVEVDHAKRVNELENFLTSKDTKFSVENLSGTYYNAHINEADGTIGDKATNFRNIKVLKATDGKRTMIWKIGGGNDAEGEICLNPLLKVPSLPNNVIVKLPPHTPVGHNPRPRHPKPPVTTPPPTVTPIPQPKPPVTPSPGKDATKSPVTADPNNPIEALRPNIPAPAVAPQPVGAPEKDPYVVVAPVVGNTTRPDIVVDPRPEGTVATDTPVSSPNTNDAPATGVVTGP